MTSGDDGHPVDLRCSVLLLRGDTVLLCGRTDTDDLWVLPGGTPRRGEGTAAAARREVAEETGLQVEVRGVAFVLEASSWGRERHRVEIVFVGVEENPGAVPVKQEDHLDPMFVPLAELDQFNLRPPIGGYIRGFWRSRRTVAAYLGNLWRSDAHETIVNGS